MRVAEGVKVVCAAAVPAEEETEQAIEQQAEAHAQDADSAADDALLDREDTELI